MPPKNSNPASGDSRSRVGKLDVPARKFDNDQYSVFRLGSIGTEAAKRHVCSHTERIDGGQRHWFQYEDRQGLALAPPYRVYRVDLGYGSFYEMCPCEDLTLYSAPLLHVEERYRLACTENALARTEFRRIHEANPACPLDFGLGDEGDENFWAYLQVIEVDDHAAIARADLSPREAQPAETFRDPTLVLSDWRLWWRPPV